MNPIHPQRPRFRLDQDDYKQLCRTVLERDNWHCQYCGAMKGLQVHHMKLRSHSGDDSEANLITLCDTCHELIHREGG